MTSHDKLTAAVTVALCMGAVVLSGVSQDASLIWRGWLLAAVVSAVAIGARHLRLPITVVPLLQLLVMLVFAYLLSGVPLSSADGWGVHLRTLFVEAIGQIQSQIAPLAASAETRLVLLLLLGFVCVITYVLAVSLEAPAWTLAALTTLYVVPAITLPQVMAWWRFAALALGFLVVLATSTGIENSAWSRNLLSKSGERASGLAAWQAAAWIAVPAIAAALVLGVALPAGHAIDLTNQNHRGQGPIQMSDPLVDLTRDLNNQSEQVVLTYRSSNNQPQYLRTAALTRMTDNGWQLEPLNLREGNPSDPPGGGLDSVRVTTRISIGQLDGQYLPAPYAPQEVSAGDGWAYDPVTLTIISTASGAEARRATRDLSYTVVSDVPTPGAGFSEANAGTGPDAGLTALPSDLPASITTLAAMITRGATSDAQRAIAIQRYLADPGRFTYSVRAPSGNGIGAMESFLFRDRRGYCVHFASAMALLARIEGIPSRVAVGFLPGTRVGDHYEVRAGNAHAWPELWFADYGWVRFEPTASIATPPSWTDENTRPSATPSASQTPTPTTTASPTPTTAPTLDPSVVPTTDPTPPGGGARLPSWLAPLLAGLGIALGVIALALVPFGVRLALRRRRVRADGPDRAEAAWAEVRDTLLDTGGSWPPGSPRQIAAAIRPRIASATTASEHLDTISGWVERGRYARSADIPPLADSIDSVRAGLLAPASRSTLLRARFWPRSLWHAMMERFTPGDPHDTDRTAGSSTDAADRDH